MNSRNILSVNIYNSSFGCALKEREFSGEKYRYGFQNQEMDDELKGEGNSYDFGERLFDSRLGRWLAIDRLSEKYPELSPYSFTANNSILLKENQGADYGIYIDHVNHTITIRQTIYTTTADAAEATSAANGWNSQSGEFEYVVGTGAEAQSYKINFEISVVESATWEERDEAYTNDESGEANTYQVVEAGELGDNNAETSGEPGANRGASRIRIEPGKQKQRETGKHEIGHTLGLGHWGKGIMKRGLTRLDNELEVTPGNVSMILSRAGIGIQKGKGNMDYQKEPSVDPARATKHTEGDVPENFDQGKVQKAVE